MRTFLLLGSNVGDRAGNLDNACRLISKEISVVHAESPVYETAPWGKINQPSFLNMAVAIETALSAEALLENLKSIEKILGRTNVERWGPRIIDIDILMMESMICRSEMLTVPHPHLHLRRFALLPLSQIAPEAQHPVLKLSIRELLGQCPDDSDVKLYFPALHSM